MSLTSEKEHEYNIFLVHKITMAAPRVHRNVKYVLALRDNIHMYQEYQNKRGNIIQAKCFMSDIVLSSRGC